MNRQHYDVIGDIHGCNTELSALIAKLGYESGVCPVMNEQKPRCGR